MLQRAASNAYSWWWASHVRTKQSKWLEHNLEDMEEKVKHMLKIFDDDGDSFARRAEMYYKSRPELINFVEESYKAYRALAERYEHIASELQTANQTIATVFPEHAQIAMDEEDDDGSPKASARKFPDGLPDATNISKFKMPLNARCPPPATERKTKKTKARKTDDSLQNKSEALNKIDKLQKGILVLQTEKEFTKGLYENGLAKYWEIENRISDMQKEVSGLQEEYGIGKVIEDDEARTLMAATALKSCQETLIRLQEKRERSIEEARVENQRIKDVCEKLEILKNEYLHNQMDLQKFEKDKSEAEDASMINVEQGVTNSKEEKWELELIFQKINEHFSKNSDAAAAAAVTELAETIDELVTKIINLETSVSSQTSLIERLKSETNELQTKMQSFEKNKETQTKGSNDLNSELQHLDNELRGIQELNKNVQNQNSNLRMHFTEAHSEFKHISEELHGGKQQDAVVSTGVLTAAMDQDPLAIKSHQDFNTEVDKHNPFLDPVNPMEVTKGSEKVQDLILRAEDGKENVSEKHHEAKRGGDADEKLDLSDMKDTVVNAEAQDKASDEEDEPNWQQLFLDGLEDREKILLVEYTSALRNVREAKKKLSEQERKSQEALIEMTLQIRELKSANVMKDEEMRSLRQKVNLLQSTPDRNSDTHFPDVENPQKPVSPLSNTPRIDADNKHVSELSGDQVAAATSRVDSSSGAAETPTKEGTEAQAIPIGEAHSTLSTVEEKFRRDIDELLEENLKFWWKFSTSFQQIQKFQSTAEDLEAEYSKFKESKKDDKRSSSATDDGDTATDQPLMSDGQPFYDNLKEIKKETAVWMEEYEKLKEELQCRRESLCSIQEEISRVSKEGSEYGSSVEFTSYQAAKFQGEVLNMQQENNKVADELELGVEHVRAAENEIEKTMVKLKEDLKLPGSRSRHGELRHSSTGTQIPLRSFIFGSKTKKQKPRIFPRIHPALHRTHVKSKPSPD